jgi:hypothetical protein
LAGVVGAMAGSLAALGSGWEVVKVVMNNALIMGASGA